MAKKLLNERTVRRFQRLANVSPINEMYSKRDDDMEEGMYKRDDEEVMKEKEDDMDMGDDKDMDMGDDKGMDMDKGDDMGDEDLMEALAGINYIPSQGEIVNEVAQRVARRLKEAKLHEAKLNRALGKKNK